MRLTDTKYILDELTRIQDEIVNLGNGSIIEAPDRLHRLVKRVACLIEDVRRGTR